MIDRQIIFDHPLRNNLGTYDSIQKISTDQGKNYTNGCSLANNCFKNYYKMIAIDLRIQQALDADPKAIQKINFTGNLAPAAGATMFFIIKEGKEPVL